ncbi:uncharacterized protein LOC117123079 isoform X2 [Anneissia japonica]|uniref:uncharacterized protein LOC117123079 isoform X2 n=1 Tax=Anneissia japonica TaxID=1529436 RepID=UPI001425A7E3|nr:uncharacterized protein LOC117123079 isoform X2 [Anneissia japonica]
MSGHGIYRDSDIVLSLGNVALFLSGIVMLCATSVVQAPFRDFPRSVQICFAIMVGFYIFKALLDTIHYNHFTAYGIHTVHHLLTITLYMVFLLERQNGLCGVLGLVFQADSVFIDTSKLLSGMDKDENELVNFTWINKYTGATVTFSTRLILPATLIFLSFTKNSIFTMDLIVVMFYFLSLVFFTIWNLLMFRNAVMGCVRYSHRLKTMTFQRAIEGHSDACYRQPGSQTSDSRLRVKHNDLRRLAPCSNTNIATTRKQRDRLNNLKTPQKIPISDAIGQLHTGEPSQSHHVFDRDRWSRGRSIQVDRRSSSEYDPPSTISDVEENAVRFGEKYPQRLDTISWSTSENSGNHFLSDAGQGVTSQNYVLDGGQAVIFNTVTDNVYYRHSIPPNMYNSYVHLDGNVYLERREESRPGPSDSTEYRHSRQPHPESHKKGEVKDTQQQQSHTDAMGLTASEARLTSQLAYTDNTTEVRSPCSKTVLEGTYLPNSIQRIHIPDMSAYPQFGENQSI